MILPPGAVLGNAVQETRQTSRTYRLDIENGRIAGMIDGVESVKQFILQSLSTERFAHFIYSGNYGMERRAEGGFDLGLERWISEALLQDDRITGIQDFQATVNGDESDVSFTVVSIFGSFSERRTIPNV